MDHFNVSWFRKIKDAIDTLKSAKDAIDTLKSLNTENPPFNTLPPPSHDFSNELPHTESSGDSHLPSDSETWYIEAIIDFDDNTDSGIGGLTHVELRGDFLFPPSEFVTGYSPYFPEIKRTAYLNKLTGTASWTHDERKFEEPSRTRIILAAKFGPNPIGIDLSVVETIGGEFFLYFFDSNSTIQFMSGPILATNNPDVLKLGSIPQIELNEVTIYHAPDGDHSGQEKIIIPCAPGMAVDVLNPLAGPESIKVPLAEGQ